MNKRQLEAQNEALRDLLGNLQAVLNDSLSELDEDGEDEDEDEVEDEDEGEVEEGDNKKSRMKGR